MSRKLSLLLIVALVAAACGSSDDGASSDDTKPTATATAGKGASDTGAAPGGAVSTLEGVRSAVIQIVATGSFAEPEGGLSSFAEIEGAGSGSGFIIDPSGIAVTNNHVVTGAATLDVFVDGQEEPVKATVLGVSECSDLAVIDLEGEGYPYLSWYEGDLEPGLEVRAAGFPLGDPEYTLTSGIVSKAEVDGETNWASVESVIEHDANIQPGNSGGPLVTADTGEVVAVNYRGFDPGTGTVQFRAISSDLARPTVGQLQGGDVESLGINGIAVVDPDSGIQGVWVSSVDTDSPAGAVGVQGGDIIERIEGLSVGADGTMDGLLRHHPLTRSRRAARRSRCCASKRTPASKESSTVTSLRRSSPSPDRSPSRPETCPPKVRQYTDFVQVADDTGTVAVQVPASWSDVDGTSREGADGGPIPSIAAAPDLAGFYNTWEMPGVEVLATASSPGDDLGALLDDLGSGAECVDAGREPYEDNLYAGLAQYYSDCGGVGAALVSIAAQPPDGSFIVVVIVQMTSEADLAVLDQILQTFIVQV